MPYEENELERLAANRIEVAKADEARKARYAFEDEHTARARAEEDRLAARGVEDMDARKAELEAAIAARPEPPEMMSQKLERLMAEVAALQAKADKPAQG